MALATGGDSKNFKLKSQKHQVCQPFPIFKLIIRIFYIVVVLQNLHLLWKYNEITLRPSLFGVLEHKLARVQNGVEMLINLT